MKPNKLIMIFRKVKAWLYRKHLERRGNRSARRFDRKMKRVVNEIRKCTGVQLYGWQLPWVGLSRGVAEYHSEEAYGRRNGKTTANIFRLLLAGVDIYVNVLNEMFVIWGPEDHDSAMFMKEDFLVPERREYYIVKLAVYYELLKTSKNKIIKQRLSRLHYGENPGTEKKV